MKPNKKHTPDPTRNVIADEIDSSTRTREEMSREYGKISREETTRYLKDLLGALGIKSAQPLKVKIFIDGRIRLWSGLRVPTSYNLDVGDE